MKKLEEEFKFLWRQNHPDLDLEYIGKYDAKSKTGGLIIEFKSSCNDWKKMITQALLTSAKEGKKFKIIGAVSQEFPEGKFIDTFNCKISIRTVKAFNAVPSAWNSVEWQLAHKSLEPLYKERPIPTKEELETIERAYQIQNKYTKKEKEILKLGFGNIFGEGKKIIQTNWAVPEDLDKLNAYFTPELLRSKVKEIVIKNWPNIKYIWDPYGGDGSLVNQFNCDIFISDIEPQGSGIIEMDFLLDKVPDNIKNKFGVDFAIVTNPSFGKKHIHNLINFCRNNKVKLATFGYCGDFPFESLPAIDYFSTIRGKEWKEILPQFGYRRNEVIPFILFDFDKEKKDHIRQFEFTNKDTFIQHRVGSRCVGAKLPNDYFRRASHIDTEIYGGKILTKDLYEKLIKETSEMRRTNQKISWSK